MKKYIPGKKICERFELIPKQLIEAVKNGLQPLDPFDTTRKLNPPEQYHRLFIAAKKKGELLRRSEYFNMTSVPESLLAKKFHEMNKNNIAKLEREIRELSTLDAPGSEVAEHDPFCENWRYFELPSWKGERQSVMDMLLNAVYDEEQVKKAFSEVETKSEKSGGTFPTLQSLVDEATLCYEIRKTRERDCKKNDEEFSHTVWAEAVKGLNLKFIIESDIQTVELHLNKKNERRTVIRKIVQNAWNRIHPDIKIEKQEIEVCLK